METQPLFRAGQSSLPCVRIYIRREGGHFVGLCAELQQVINGYSVEDIVDKTKVLVKRALRRQVPLTISVSSAERREKS